MHSSRMRTVRSSSRLLRGSASVHAGIPSPGCGPGDPPSVGLETPGQTPQLPLDVGLETPQARPLNFPLWCGPGDLQGML